jgi:hypothetical protein
MASPKRKSFPLRIDPNLWTEIESWAHQDFRSVNGQIEFLLREAVRRRKGNKTTQAEDQVEDPNQS